MLPAWSVHGNVEVGEKRCQWEPLRSPQERLFPSLQPLGIGRAIQETRFFEEKEFISEIANVVMSHGTRVEISWEMCMSRFPSADGPLGEAPAPAPPPRGPERAAPLGADTGASRRCRADALLWKLGK